MSDIQKNKQIVLQFYNHLMAREFDAAMQMLDQDIEWWTNGSESFSGTHKGRDTVTALFAPLRDHVAVLKFTFGAFTAEEDRVAFEMVSESKMTNGLVKYQVMKTSINVESPRKKAKPRTSPTAIK